MIINYRQFKKLLSKFVCLLIIIISGILSDASAQLANTSWPMFGNNPQHTGQSSFLGPKNGEKK